MNRPINRKWTFLVVLLTIVLVAAVVLINFVIDPLQIYRKAFYPASFQTAERYQLPGIARNFPYDTIVLGSSTSQNIFPSYLEQQMGGRAANLAISGGLPYEQYLLAKLALDTGKVKRVIWRIDYFALRVDPRKVREQQGPFPYYLYDRNPFNDIKYLFNVDTFRDSINNAMNVMLHKEVPNRDLDKLYKWTDPAPFGRDKVLPAWKKRTIYKVNVDNDEELYRLNTNMDQNILALIRKHPEVEFDLYYPPYTILEHRFYYLSNPQLFENELYVKRHLFEETRSLPNVRLYDFQQEKRITFDLENYKDLAHHTYKINEWVVRSIAKDQIRVTEEAWNGIKQWGLIIFLAQ